MELSEYKYRIIYILFIYMHGSWHAPFFSTRAKPSYTNGYHHKEGGTVGGTVTVPKTEPLFSLNKGSISPKQSLCFTEMKALFH